MNDLRSTVGVIAILLLPASLYAQEQAKQCQLQGSPEAHLAQQMLTQAQDTTRSEEQQQAAYKQAWNAVQGPIDSETDNPTPYILGAQVQVGLENYARADTLLNQFLENAGEGCAQLANQIRFQAWANLYNGAIQAFNDGNQQQALELFEQANAIYTDSRSLVNAAALLEQEGRQSEAMERYRQALEAGGDPQQMRSALSSLARFYQQQDSAAKALGMYESYLADNPDDVTIQVRYAQALSAEGMQDSAQSVYQSLLDREGLSFEQLSELGIGFYQSGDYERAAEIFARAREKRPLNKETMENLASSLLQTQEWEKLASLTDTLISWYPYDAKNYQAAVRSNDRTGQKKKAQQLLNDLKNAPLQFVQLGLNEAGSGNYILQGQLETTSAEMAGEAISIPFEFLGPNGEVVTTEHLTVRLPAQGERTQVRLRVNAGTEVATFRYDRVGD